MGGIPRLFMAVAQALGSDIGIVIELESIDMLQIPSAREQVTHKGVSPLSVAFKLHQPRPFQERESYKISSCLRFYTVPLNSVFY